MLSVVARLKTPTHAEGVTASIFSLPAIGIQEK